MGWILTIFVILIPIVLFALRYPKFLYNSIITFPRDIFGLYMYIYMSIFCFYCKFMNLKVYQRFDTTASKNKDKTCFYFEDEVWSYQKVQETTLKIAKSFQDKGYKKGDVIGLFMESRPEFVCVWLGLSRLGVVTSFFNYNLRLNSLEHCLRASNCKGLIFGTELTAALQDLADTGGLSNIEIFSMDDRKEPEERITVAHTDITLEMRSMSNVSVQEFSHDIDNSDIAIHVFTSGTTGLPKAVLMSHSRLFTYGAVFFPTEMDPKKDILLTPIPLYHVQGGLLGVTCAIFHGVPQVIVRKFSATTFWKLCIKYNATYCQYLGEIIRYLYNQPEQPEDRSHKVHTFYGNGVNPAIWEKFVKRFNIKIKEMYGSTEGNCSTMNIEAHVGAISYFPIWLVNYLPACLVKVDPVSGEILRDKNTGLALKCKINEPGEVLGLIQKRNPFREFNGYTDSAATAKKIAHDVRRKGDNWFRTGDVMRMDDLGYLYFLDRTGDTYRWKGENVSTAEVEEVMTKASGFKSSVVYGVPVPGYEGKCGMATTSDPEGNLDLIKLAGTIQRYLPPYARPLFIRVLDSDIPMTGTFKLQKNELQKEGFNVNVLKDPIYFLKKDKYIPMDGELYNDIINGEIRL